jgi:hypothetical protein
LETLSDVDVAALTRMNWNSADFASAEPITLGFARKIGLILSELQSDVNPERSFRYYVWFALRRA